MEAVRSDNAAERGPVSDSSPWLDTKAASAYTKLSESYLTKARMARAPWPGPKFKKVGRRVLYKNSWLDSFIESSE